MVFTPTLTLPLRGRGFGGERSLVCDGLGFGWGAGHGGVVLGGLGDHRLHVLFEDVAFGG